MPHPVVIVNCRLGQSTTVKGRITIARPDVCSICVVCTQNDVQVLQDSGMVEQFLSAHLVSWLIFRYVKKYTDLKANLILRLSWFCASLMVAVSSKKKGKERGVIIQSC